MKTVNLGKKYTHRVTLRLNDEQYDWLLAIAGVLGVTPSDYMRMSINTGMVTVQRGIISIDNGEVGTNENVKTDSNDKL